MNLIWIIWHAESNKSGFDIPPFRFLILNPSSVEPLHLNITENKGTKLYLLHADMVQLL